MLENARQRHPIGRLNISTLGNAMPGIAQRTEREPERARQLNQQLFESDFVVSATIFSLPLKPLAVSLKWSSC